jgi:hypothetical protein
MGGSFTSASLGGLAKKFKKMADQGKKKYLDLLKKKGEKNPRDFDSLKKEFTAKVRKDLKTMEPKMTPSVLGALGGGFGTSSDDKFKDKLEETGINALAKSKGVSFPTAPSGPLSPTKLFGDDDGLDGKLGGDSKPEDLNSADALSEFENAEGDINKDTGVSIFEMLSQRYRRSAFPIFFVKKKTGADEKEGEPEAAPAK